MNARMEIIASAPNQNRDNFRDHLERLIPYFAAHSLNAIISSQNEENLPSIDMWNSFGHQMDQSYKQQTRFDGATRAEYSDLLIDEKYTFLKDIGIDVSKVQILRDDDPEVMTRITQKIRNLFDKGAIYEDDESVSICMQCGNIIAVAAVNATICHRCNNSDIGIEKRKMLFMDLPGNRQEYLRDKIVLPRKSNFIKGQFATLPGRVMIARTRDYGQPLGIPGYEEFVLDPKIGLALLPEVATDKFNIDTIVQVQGATTAKNTAPYTRILSPEVDAKYIFTGNIPSGVDEDRLSELGVDFFTKYLPLYILDRTGNTSESQIHSLHTEHSKAKRKMQNALYYLESNSKTGNEEMSVDLSRLLKAIGRIAAYDIRCGVLDARKYIHDELGGSYIENLRKDETSIAPHDLGRIKENLERIF